MGYAFISYSTKNQSSADAMRKLFNKHNIDTWMAPYDIPAGSKYAAVITQAIRDCSCFVLLLSNDSQASEAVDSEVELATLTFKKSIITVELEKVILNDAFTFYIHNKQIIAAHKIDEDSREIQQILEAVRAYTGVTEKADMNADLTELQERYPSDIGLLNKFLNIYLKQQESVFINNCGFKKRKNYIDFLKKHFGEHLLYVEMQQFLDEMVLLLRERSTLETLYDKYQTCDVLVIDDFQFCFGKETTQETIYRVLKYRAENNLSTIIFSNSEIQNMSVVTANCLMSILDTYEKIGVGANIRKKDDNNENTDDGSNTVLGGSVFDIDSIMNIVATKTLSESDIERMRSQSNIAKSLAVPIGKDLDGNTVLLDLSCKKDGSNGIIFGPKGCGNEQFIYTYFILLSLFFSPEDIQLHIVDLFNDNQTKAMQRLPHLGECLVQDNDDAVTEFINMLNQEKLKRKELLDKYNVLNVYQYLNLREANKSTMPPMPHIIIGLKEIRYFKPEYPNAFEELNQLARNSDTLGIHCIYNTQFFNGIVDESIYNIADFKLCSISQHDGLDPESDQKVELDKFYFHSQLYDNIREIQLARFSSRVMNPVPKNGEKPKGFLIQTQDVNVSLINAIARYEL